MAAGEGGFFEPVGRWLFDVQPRPFWVVRRGVKVDDVDFVVIVVNGCQHPGGEGHVELAKDGVDVAFVDVIDGPFPGVPSSGVVLLLAGEVGDVGQLVGAPQGFDAIVFQKVRNETPATKIKRAFILRVIRTLISIIWGPDWACRAAAYKKIMLKERYWPENRLC